MTNSGSRKFAALILFAALSVSACASIPETQEGRAEYDATNDPFEPMNRTIFDFNDFLDRLLFRPVAELYRWTVPPPLRDRVAGIVSNMREPVIFANDLLQADPDKATTTFGRFAINTTAGIGGMFDFANDLKLYQQTGDFGQTLYVWGVGEGPYLVLPLLGPSNIRDAIGIGVDALMSPWQYLAGLRGPGTENRFDLAYFSADGIIKREQNIEALDALRTGSLDFYAQMRSVYRQYRDKQLGTSSSEGMPKYDDFAQ